MDDIEYLIAGKGHTFSAGQRLVDIHDRHVAHKACDLILHL